MHLLLFTGWLPICVKAHGEVGSPTVLARRLARQHEQEGRESARGSRDLWESNTDRVEEWELDDELGE